MTTTTQPSVTQPCSTEQEEFGKAENSKVRENKGNKERKHLNLNLYSLLKK